MTHTQTYTKVRVFVATFFLIAAGIGAYVLVPKNIEPCPCDAFGRITEDFSTYNHADLPDNMEIVRSAGDAAYVYDMNGFKFFTIWSKYVLDGQLGDFTRTDVRYTNIPTSTNNLDIQVTGYYGSSVRHAMLVFADETASDGYYIVWHDRDMDIPDNNIRIYKQDDLALTLLAQSNVVGELSNPSLGLTTWRVTADGSTGNAVITVYEQVGDSWNELVSYTDSDAPIMNGGVSFSQYKGESINSLTEWTIEFDEIPPPPIATVTSLYDDWQGSDVILEYTLTQPGSVAQILNILATSNTGIYYSLDGNVWQEATDAGKSSDGKEGLLTDSNGEHFRFVWDAATDLPETENETVYLRLRATNGSNTAPTWSTSTAFQLDTKAPIVNAPLLASNISTSSVTLSVPSSTDNGSGVHQWLLLRGTSTVAIIAASSTTYTDTNQQENTSYTYSVQLSDVAGNTSTATGSVHIYTRASDPTVLDVARREEHALTVQTAPMPNDTVQLSGYFFENMNSGATSGWIQTPTWKDSTAQCNNTYQYAVKKRNQEGIETHTYHVSLDTEGCPAASLPNTSYLGGGGGNNAVGGFPSLSDIQIITSTQEKETIFLDMNQDLFAEETTAYCDYPQSVPYKSPYASTVYLLKPSVNGCVKQAFSNEAMYFAYFDSWKVLQEVLFLPDIPVASPLFVEFPLHEGMLVMENSDPKVYLVIHNNDRLELRHIPNEASFLTAGYRWDDIFVYESLPIIDDE